MLDQQAGRIEAYYGRIIGRTNTMHRAARSRSRRTLPRSFNHGYSEPYYIIARKILSTIRLAVVRDESLCRPCELACPKAMHEVFGVPLCSTRDAATE